MNAAEITGVATATGFAFIVWLLSGEPLWAAAALTGGCITAWGRANPPRRGPR